MARFGSIIGALTLLLSLSGIANADLVTDGPWVVDGFDVVAWNGSDLVFTSQVANGADFDLEGYFDWSSNGQFRGRELFTGTLFEDQSVHLEGYELIDPINIQLSIYDADLAPSGRRLVDGTFVGISGSPSGVWSASAVPEPSLALPALAAVATLYGIRKRRRGRSTKQNERI